MSWGHSTSADLVNWKRSSRKTPALKPDAVYDTEGVFTGCLYPTGPRGEKGQLTVIYTSVCKLPIHWSIPYPRGAEGLAIATSIDGGMSWTKFKGNPILKEEPEGIHVTGFRDPFLGGWKAMDGILGPGNLYGLVSGGIHDKGPVSFLYIVDPNDLTSWKYLGKLLEFPRNFRPSKKWSGDFGVNLECANFMNLSARGMSRDFFLAGSEGGEQRDWIKSSKPPLPQRTVRWCHWFSGSLLTRNGGVTLDYEFGGILDHGCWYAANSFHDPVKGRRIVWGWIPEEDVSSDFCAAKGWNGCLGVPRELSLLVIPNVEAALVSSLMDIRSVKKVEETDGATSLHTLGIKPLTELENLRQKEAFILENITLPTKDSSVHKTPFRSSIWELSATISLTRGCNRLGILIHHNLDYSTSTRISFSPDDEEIIIDRSKSNTDSTMNKCDERGPHTLFTRFDGDIEIIEKLTMRVFSDGQVLEIFANDRFALATMVYVEHSDAVGVSLFAEGHEGGATFEQVKMWEMGRMRHD
jgi:beta-fructofuranosidase